MMLPNSRVVCSVSLGMAQVVLGLSCIIAQVVAIRLQVGWFHVGAGIWCGCMFCVTGFCGVAAGMTKRKQVMVTFLVLAVLSALVFVILLVYCAYEGWTGPLAKKEARDEEASYRIHVALLVLSCLEFVLAVGSSVVCCGALCCSKSRQNVDNNIREKSSRFEESVPMTASTVTEGISQPSDAVLSKTEYV